MRSAGDGAGLSIRNSRGVTVYLASGRIWEEHTWAMHVILG